MNMKRATFILFAAVAVHATFCFAQDRPDRNINGRIAWVEFIPYDATAIFTAQPNGAQPRQITFPVAGNFWDTHTGWTADGEAIVLSETRPDFS